MAFSPDSLKKLRFSCPGSVQEELERLLAISQQKVVSAHQWTSEVQRDADAVSARYRGLRRRVGRHVTSACRR